MRAAIEPTVEPGSPAARLRAIVDSGTFMWAQDEQTLRDCLNELERLELYRFIQRTNTASLNKLLDRKPE